MLHNVLAVVRSVTGDDWRKKRLHNALAAALVLGSLLFCRPLQAAPVVADAQKAGASIHTALPGGEKAGGPIQHEERFQGQPPSVAPAGGLSARNAATKNSAFTATAGNATPDATTEIAENNSALSPGPDAEKTGAPLAPAAPGGALPAAPAKTPAPVWDSLRARLAADGLSGPDIDGLFVRLGATPDRSAMRRKLKELFPLPTGGAPAVTPAPRRYYRGVVSQANAARCREFIARYATVMAEAQRQYGVPPSIMAALLFVETRLGSVPDKVPAASVLAGMAISGTPGAVPLPAHVQANPALLARAQTLLPKRADWAYRELRALLRYARDLQRDPYNIGGSIYGAIGVCQFMPSNVEHYGADGDGDGKVDLFSIPDAIFSLCRYLSLHGWKPGMNREEVRKCLYAYNHAAIYANTIQALADVIDGLPLPQVP